MSVSVSGNYFDGKSSRRIPVRLSSVDQSLHLTGEGIDRIVPPVLLNIMEPMGKTHRRILFRDGGYCEIAPMENPENLLAALGHRESREVSWQFNIKAVLVSLVLSTTALALLYYYALPQFTTWTANRIHPHFMDKASEETLSTLDKQLLRPSLLSRERQQSLENRLQLLLATAPAISEFTFTLQFRSAPSIGPNAFALPNGSIILLDELTRLLDDDEIVAVLAHEIGHVSARDGLRQLIQGSLVGAITAWYIGDASSLLASLPAAALSTRYSRTMESEADHYGAILLIGQHISPNLLADALRKLQDIQQSKASDFVYFSSHPLTADRIRQLRQFKAP
jgi:Zn-dependent protease with chaperone function